MKLYNNNTVKQYKTIQTNDGTFYPEKLTAEQLNGYGYYVVREDREEILQFHTLQKTEAMVNNEWVITYSNVANSLQSIKDSMINEILDISKQKLNDAVSKYSVAEMAAWETLEKESVSFLNTEDISLSPMLEAEANITNQTYSEIATKIIDKATQFKQLRSYVVGTRHNKEIEIGKLNSISECQEYYKTITNW